MLGFASAPSNVFSDQSATAAINMRESCKNILYVIANSGYYAGVESDPATEPDGMTKFFRKMNIGIGVVLVLLEALAAFAFLRRKKEDEAA